MSDEIDQLRETIEVLESQRGTLGEVVVDAAVGPLRERLAGLTTPEQRKLVTVLFADLVDFTPLSERLDAEDVREVMSSYFERWSRCIADHGGVIEKFIGDAVMAVFGLGAARENDTEQAIRTALAMMEMLEPLNDELERDWGIRVAMRVGINTGVVLVSLEHDHVGILGDSVNLAARLQTAAPVNGILISEASYQHVAGVFEVEPLDPITVKGKSEPISVYLVRSALPRSFRTSTRGVEGVESPMIGREAELALLKEMVTIAREDGERLMATVIGDAGLGKSRLIYELLNWLAGPGSSIFVLTGRGSIERATRPFGLVRDAIELHLHIRDTDRSEVVLEKLTTGIRMQLPNVSDDTPELVGWLLGFGLGLAAPASPEEARAQAVERLVAMVESLAVADPVVILAEDIHWADDASLEFLKRLMRPDPAATPGVVVVATARPGLLERRPKWAEGEGFHRLLSLDPLSKHQARRLVAEVLSRVDVIPETLRDLIVANAEGNPFYVEELVKMLMGDGVIDTADDPWQVRLDALSGLRVPATLTGVLQARFDSLDRSAQLALQEASVIGRVFWDRAVAFLGGSEDLTEVLADLRTRGMIREREISDFGDSREFVFHHALLREVVYDSVPKRRRHDHHRRAAEWLEQVTSQTGRVDEYAAQIADNYVSGQDPGMASGWYRRAGQLAASRFANTEALAMFQKAIDTGSSDDDGFRFDVVMGRSRVFEMTGDYDANRGDIDTLLDLAAGLDNGRRAQAHNQAARYVSARGRLAEAVEHAETARRFAREAGDIELEALALDEWGIALWKQADLEPARRITEEAIEVIRGKGLDLIEAHQLRRMGMIAELEGRYDEMRTYYEEAHSRYRRFGSRREVSRILNDLGVGALKQSDPAEAVRHLSASLDLKREIGDRVGEVIVLNNLALASHNLGDLESARNQYQEVLVLCTELDDLEGIASGLHGIGVIESVFGRYEEARQRLVAACDRYEELNDREGLSGCLTDLATAVLGLGDARQAQELAERAERYATETGLATEGRYAALLIGQAHLASGRDDEAAVALRPLVDGPVGADPALEIYARAAFAEALVGAGDLRLAVATAREALEMLEAGPVAGMTDPVAVLLSAHSVLVAADDPHADELIARAVDRLGTMAGAIEDPELKASFIGNVVSHRRLARLRAKF